MERKAAPFLIGQYLIMININGQIPATVISSIVYMVLKLKSILCAFAMFSGLMAEYYNPVEPEAAAELQNFAGDAHQELPVEKSRYAVFFDEELPSKVFNEVIEWANTNNIKINEEMNKKYIKFLSLDLSPQERNLICCHSN